MKKYEAVFILDIRKVEDDGTAFSADLKKFIETDLQGSVTETHAMGRKQFAREIKKRKAGVYWNYFFSLDAAKVGDVRNHYRLDERVLRMLIVENERPE